MNPPTSDAPHGQPPLHDLVSTTCAPTTALSESSGQIRPVGVRGVFHADVRALCAAVLRFDGREPEPVLCSATGPSETVFVGVVGHLGDPGADPTVRMERRRQTTDRGLIERVDLLSHAREAVRTTLTLDLASDLVPVEIVRAGLPAPRGPEPALADGQVSWRSNAVEVLVEAAGAVVRPAEAGGAQLTWPIELAPGCQVSVCWRLLVTDRHAVVRTPDRPVEWSRPSVTTADHRLDRLLERSLADLEALRLAEIDHPEDTFLGAGVPWFLTLFGRDSIWAARMLLPLGTDLAAGTLRTLARRQGRRVDPVAAEAPGKIMHELRRAELVLPGNHNLAQATELRLPAVYYGTIDATPLWISLLHEAWLWGMPAAEVEALVPALESALSWIADHGDPDGDGFLEYQDLSGTGLANQGWKDSSDAVRFRDGRFAAPPIALCEVQGYAHAAAVCGADLLEAFGRPGADRWRAYALGLASRFRDRFWVEDAAGPYPALALDSDKRPVDAVTSNIGHLLGTGLLTGEEETAVARRLARSDLAGGYGLRTMSSQSGAFNPLSYHCGSVWSHDTAIVLSGLARTGHVAEAAVLAEGLLSAAEAFDYRLPELHSGDSRRHLPRPVAYPTACRPQAWSAAAAGVLLASASGIEPDLPAGWLRVRPELGQRLGGIGIRGLRLADSEVGIDIASDGTTAVTGLPRGCRWSREDSPN